MQDKTKEIAKLNDLLRNMPGDYWALGHYMSTPGIHNLDVFDQYMILGMVETFDDFTSGNDPRGERDFGAFDYKGQRIFWKIDYYDNTLTAGSEDPSDWINTTRVLTVMLASE